MTDNEEDDKMINVDILQHVPINDHHPTELKKQFSGMKLCKKSILSSCNRHSIKCACKEHKTNTCEYIY